MRGALGLEKDEGKAVEWYTKAAVQGSMGAQYQLGLCFERGVGTTREPTEAAKWYRLAAEQGHAGGLVHSFIFVIFFFFHSVYLHIRGMLFSHDDLSVAPALIFFPHTLALSADAQHNLGRAYETGMGVAKNLTAALHWCEPISQSPFHQSLYASPSKRYKAAADQGHHIARADFDRLYLE